MRYPFWDIGLGYGVFMGVIAILHVFVSHFAIGGGLYLVVSERAARRARDTQRLAFLERLSRFFVLLTLVFGALSGVAIWFIIGLLNPNATAALIHNFVWAWATEWTFFFVEILAAILYYYGWRRLPARQHMAIGWIYFAAAWLSLFVINGIVTFMLTPGDWLATGSFWDGFFNPTYWPSLVLRTGVCLLLAGLFALLVATRHGDATSRRRILRGAAAWGLVGLVVAGASFLWYAEVGVLADELIPTAEARLSVPVTARELLAPVGVVLAAGLFVFGLLRPRLLRTSLAVVMLAAGLVGFGAFEWFRESLRKPWVIPGYMYAHGLPLDRFEDYERDGMLAHVDYRTGDDGADLFRYACRTCHTLDGYNGLKAKFDGLDAAYIAQALQGLHKMRSPMPPFPGTDEEREALGAWIHARVDQRHLAEIHGLEGAALGAKVYQMRCGSCHVRGGHGDLTETLSDVEAQDVDDLLSDDEMAEEMPVFSGDDRERRALIDYILSWGKGGGR